MDSEQCLTATLTFFFLKAKKNWSSICLENFFK